MTRVGGVNTQVLMSDYGRLSLEVGPDIPTVALEWLLARVHCATPDREILRNVRDRTRNHGYTRRQRRETYQAALWIHAENYALYAAVMTGQEG